MKKWLFVFAMLPMIAVAQTTPKTTTKTVSKTTTKAVVPPKPKGFTIEGKLDGFTDGTEVLMYKNGENVESAKTTLQKGKFVLKGAVTEPTLCFIIIGGEKPIEIFVENAVISVKGKKMEPPVYEVEGSASHKDFASFIKTFLPLAKEQNTLAATINSTPPGEEREKMMVNYNKVAGDMQKEIDRFVKDKPKSYVSAFILNQTYRFNEDVMLLETRFNALDQKIQNSETGLQLKEFIAESKVGAVGTQAIDFSQPDTTGTPVSLSSFRGKYVLVDFWASWCGPCRNENPNVVENFKKFSAKNFTVLGVSLDRPGQKDKWVNAINDDHLTWTHVSDLQFWNNSAAVLYKIKGIPQNILVDPQGKIVAKNLRGPELQAKLCELLGCEGL